MGEDSDQDFVVLRDGVSGGQRRAEPPFMAGKTAFRLSPLTILPLRKAVIHHPSVTSRRGAVGSARIDGNDGAADTQLFTAHDMVMFRVVGFVRHNPPRTQMGRRLPHGREKIRRIVAGSPADHRPDDQLRSGMENSGQLGPGGVRGIGQATAALEVNRHVACFQPRGVDRRRIAGVLGDQAAGPAPLATSLQKSFVPPFLRSFCSKYHNVE